MGSNPSTFKGENLPVENVTWDDVQVFISQLNERKDGWTYRLPTEAEWEYAARGGNQTAHVFGDDPSLLDEYGWHHGNSGGKTNVVASKKPIKTFNHQEIYDMNGNGWEWVADWYGAYSTGAVVDPTGPSTGSGRVFRGCSWSGNARLCRSAFRYYFRPGLRHGSVGFRLARTRKK
jgi:formylglycine-generating enzyme required for sulfatase activity